MNEKEISMYFHTSIRNVGIYTSISLALLGYSRFYRGKNIIYNISFIVISLLFLLCAIYINHILNKTLNVYAQTENKNRTGITFINDLVLIPKYVAIILPIVLLFGLFTLYREVTKQH